MSQTFDAMMITRDAAEAILQDQKMSWEDKFRYTFVVLMPAARLQLKELTGNGAIDYYDPDSSYEDDTRAALNAMIERIDGVSERDNGVDALAFVKKWMEGAQDADS